MWNDVVICIMDYTHTELPGRLETWRKVSGPPICPFLVFYHPLSSF